MPCRFLSLAATAAWILTATLAFGQESAAAKAESITPMIRQMAGTWKVQSKMWPAPNATAFDLAPAIARREVVRNAYLQEVMDLAGEPGPAAFTRVAYFVYNTINQQYEYFSVDSRLPQLMSYTVPGANRTRGGTVELTGSSFVAPEWGTKKNVPFIYRLTIGPVEQNKQVVQLFLTEQKGQSAEFLAFEYVYTRQP